MLRLYLIYVTIHKHVNKSQAEYLMIFVNFQGIGHILCNKLCQALSVIGIILRNKIRSQNTHVN
jgi:hypothetical protein